MTGLFGGSASNQVNNTTPPVTSLRVQTSVAGKAIPIVAGQVRLAPNLIDAQDFTSTTKSNGGGGGGGGGKGGGGSCVGLEAPIATPDGDKKLGEIAIGDVIWSHNPITGAREPGTVEQILDHDMEGATDGMLAVYLRGALDPLPITTNHYPWIDGICRREMKDWNVGEELIALDGSRLAITAIEPAPKPARTRNLVVTPHHNFFAAGVLLHNGFGGGGGKGTTETDYSVAPVYGICEGPVAGFIQVWKGQTAESLASLNITAYLGGYPGDVSGYMAAAHPANALPYPGLARAEATPMDLGTSPNLPNINFEVLAANNSAIAGLPDADPQAWLVDLLSNANYGVGFPSARIADLTLYSLFCKANGLVISDALTDQRALSEYLKDLLEATYSEFVFVDGALNVFPRGMQTVTGNGYTYNAPAVDYTLAIDDFLPNVNAAGTSSSSGALSSDPVVWTVKRRSDLNNQVTVNCLDRANGYNPNPQVAQDLAAIEDFGLRAATPKSYSFFMSAAAALTSAHYLLEREQIDKTCSFTLGMKYARVMPMSLLAGVPLPAGAGTATVRVTEITQNQDFSFSITAEEYPVGGIAPQQYNSENPNPNAPGINQPPGPINTPVLFEPSIELLQSDTPQIWAAVSGSNPPLYGGCDVYMATAAEGPYAFFATLKGASTMGATTADFQAAADPDTSDSLVVDLAASATELQSGTVFDADNAVTACLVRGAKGDEYVSYQTAALVGASTYALGTRLRRGLYGSGIVDHPAGSAFVRLNGTLVKGDYAVSQIGKTVFFKFLAFNRFGGGGEQLADAIAYPYQLTGAGFTAALPDITGLSASYIGGLTQLTWDPVSDVRSVDYEIRYGTSPLSASFVGRTANTHFQLQSGNGFYWIAAHATPVPGVEVYSENWTSIEIAGAVLVRNVVKAVDEVANAWNGTITGGLAVVGSDLVTSGNGDFLSTADFLGMSDFLLSGDAASSGYYQSAVVVDAGRAAGSYVTASFTAQGTAENADTLAAGDFLGQADFLGYGTTANIAASAQIGLSSDNVTWHWQPYQAGQYNWRYFTMRFLLASSDSATQALMSAASWEVDMPDRLDVYQGVAIPAGGLALSFQPLGAGAPIAFKGGPGGTAGTPGLPAVDVTWLNSAGDTLSITGLSLSGCTIQILNGGIGVGRTAQVIKAQGY